MATHFFDQDKPHGLVKRIMLKKILQALIPSTLHSGRKVLVIDGFAGTGVYGKDSSPDVIEMFGSPIIALKVALEHLQKFPVDERNTGPKIFLYFVEKKLKYFNALVQSLQKTLKQHFEDESSYTAEQKKGEYTFTCHKTRALYGKAVRCDFKMFDPPVEMSDRNVRCLTFIDPFGIFDTPMEVVQKFSYAPNHSLIINFMSEKVVKNGKNDREVISKLYGIDVLKSLSIKHYNNSDEQVHQLSLYLDFVLGNCFQHDEQQDSALTETQVKTCTRLYERLLKLLTNSKYALTFGMRREKEDTLMYHIVCATNELQILSHIKEAMNKVTNYGDKLEMGNFDLVIGGVVLDLANVQDENALADDIYSHFKGDERVPIGWVREYVIANTPYVFRKEPLKIMQTEGSPRITQVVDDNGMIPRIRGTFPDHTEWFITFSDQIHVPEVTENQSLRRSRRKHRFAPYPVTHTSRQRRGSSEPANNQ